MLPPENDIADRQKVWDYLQFFWMDTDPTILFTKIVDACAESKYSIDELEQIFWNEVEPAVGFNLWSIAGEWTGFEIEWLSSRILQTHKFGKPLPHQFFRPRMSHWWRRLRRSIESVRRASN